MIPLFDPTKIADFNTTHLASLHIRFFHTHRPFALPSWRNWRRRPDQALEAKKGSIRDQIDLLTGIQTRIDLVIRDLSRVLDVVAPAEGGGAEASGSLAQP